MSYARYNGLTGGSGGGSFTAGNLTDVGTDGIVITGGTNAVNGAGTSLAQHVADSTHNGYLSSTDWSTFNSKQAALTIGNLTDVGTDGITVTGGTGAVIGSGTSLSQQVSDSTHNGYLSSTDWSTFNSKQAAGSYITDLTSDVTASGPGSATATLATVNSNIGSFGSATQVAAFTVNAKGLVTAASNTTIAIPFSQVSGTVPLNQGGTGQTTKAPAFDALSPMTTGGDLIYGGASGTGTRLANGTSGQVLQSNGTTLAPTWTTNISGSAANVTGTVAIANGGTGQTTKAAGFDALSPMTTGGDIIYGGASGTGTRLANGSAGQVLTSNGTTLAPSWQPVTASSFGTTTTTSTLTGGIQLTTITVTNTNRTIDTTTNDNQVLVSTTTTPSTITLPTPTNGRTLTIKDIGGTAQTNNITIARHGSEKIDGASASLLLTFNYGFVTLVSDGTDWFVTARSSNITNWATFTPTYAGLGTPTGVSFQYRRVGDTIQIQGVLTTGTTTGSRADIILQSPFTIDNTKIVNPPVGNWYRENTSSNNVKAGPLNFNAGGNSLTFGVSEYALTTDPSNAQVGTFFANSQTIHVCCTGIGITGWGVY